MDVENLSNLIDKFSNTKFVCVGDIMLDKFVWGKVSRISPEAPIPVLLVEKEEEMLGGCGNVVRNLSELGCNGILISVVGDDDCGNDLSQISDKNCKLELITENGRTTTVKNRYIGAGQHLLRADRENPKPILDETKAKIVDAFKRANSKDAIVILSDYAKGVLTSDLVKQITRLARENGQLIIADPKGRDFSKYEGVSILTPNASELSQATGIEIKTDEDVVLAARGLIKSFDIKSVLVTRSSEGMSLVEKNSVVHIKTLAREVYDVSGAGDTVVATLAAALNSGATIEEAARLANMAAGIVVGKLGTATVLQTELKAELWQSNNENILSWDTAANLVKLWQSQSNKVVFTNGCFDLLHPGHLSLLKQAKTQGNKLVVGLNSDASVKRLKGPERPIQNEHARAIVLSNIAMVDAVVIFDEDTPLKLIETLKPDVLVKGSDYTEDKVVGAEFVKSYGGRVFLAQLVDGQSTSNTVKKMKESA